MTTPDPDTWPALLHRLATSWSTLLRLLVGLAAAAAIVTGALWLLGDVRVEFWQLVLERHVTPGLLLTSAWA